MLGAVSGMMVAPTFFLTPNMMQAVLIYAFAAAVLGGLESPVGAVVGGIGLGVMLQHARDVRASSPPSCACRSRSRVLLVVLLVRPPACSAAWS